MKLEKVPTTKSETKNLTVGRRWKLRRNIVIYIANKNGCSQRLLADVFDLSHARIAAIIKQMRLEYEK